MPTRGAIDRIVSMCLLKVDNVQCILKFPYIPKYTRSSVSIFFLLNMSIIWEILNPNSITSISASIVYHPQSLNDIHPGYTRCNWNFYFFLHLSNFLTFSKVSRTYQNTIWNNFKYQLRIYWISKQFPITDKVYITIKRHVLVEQKKNVVFYVWFTHTW